MTRRCSHCSSDGHSKRTCSTRRPTGGDGAGLRIFGVRLMDASSIKKSASLGNLSQYTATMAASDVQEGYHSDDPTRGSARRQGFRKKGTPWTEEEHRQFLVGLQKLGKGDWRGISKNYIPSKTPTQVASHAQKYFIRQSDTTKKKRRSSLFDMVSLTEADSSSKPEELRLPPPTAVIDYEKLSLASSHEADIINPHPSLDLTLKPVFMPLPFQLWPPTSSPFKDDVAEASHSRIVPEIPKEHGKEVICMALLTLDETKRVLIEPPPLSLRQLGEL